MRAMNERALVRAGYSVETACDGEEALRLAFQRTPDLILLDMLLPKLTGPEVLRSLRANPLTARVPIIVLSSLPQKNESQLKKDGATAYLEKSTVDTNADSVAQIVTKTLHDLGPDTELSRLDLSVSFQESEK